MIACDPIEARFQLAPGVQGVELDPGIAAMLTERLLAATGVTVGIDERLGDPGAVFVIGVNGVGVKDSQLEEGQTGVDLELDTAPGSNDSSQVYAAFIQGMQRALFDNPTSRHHRRSLVEARDSLLAMTRPLEPLLRQT